MGLLPVLLPFSLKKSLHEVILCLLRQLFVWEAVTTTHVYRLVSVKCFYIEHNLTAWRWFNAHIQHIIFFKIMTMVLRPENNILNLIRCSLVLAAAWLGRFSGQVHRKVSFHCCLILFPDQSTADLDRRRAAMQCYLAVPRHLSNHFYLSRDWVQRQIYIALIVGHEQQIQFLFHRF